MEYVEVSHVKPQPSMSQNVQIYNAAPQPPQYGVSNYRQNKSKQKYTLVPKKKVTVFVLGGAAPTAYRISKPFCDTKICSADITKRYVSDFGIGGLYKFNNDVSVGVVGTIQGSGYILLGVSF